VNYVCVALGSNIDPERNLREAVRRLALHCRLVAVSSVYETQPVGNTEQPSFLNAAVLIQTDLSAADLKARVLRVIEDELGRVRTEDKNAPRTIDLDIAFYAVEGPDAGSQPFYDPNTLEYAHIAVPLADVAPRMRHSATGQTLQEIAQSLPDRGLAHRPDVVLWPETVDRPIKER
jgi:2-amino-4-hydroxy-6-hydroxymethyldihydropteridine diphosphokinase